MLECSIKYLCIQCSWKNSFEKYVNNNLSKIQIELKIKLNKNWKKFVFILY